MRLTRENLERLSADESLYFPLDPVALNEAKRRLTMMGDDLSEPCVEVYTDGEMYREYRFTNHTPLRLVNAEDAIVGRGQCIDEWYELPGKYLVIEGFDHYNGRTLYRLCDEDGEVGEDEEDYDGLTWAKVQKFLSPEQFTSNQWVIGNRD